MLNQLPSTFLPWYVLDKALQWAPRRTAAPLVPLYHCSDAKFSGATRSVSRHLRQWCPPPPTIFFYSSAGMVMLVPGVHDFDFANLHAPANPTLGQPPTLIFALPCLVRPPGEPEGGAAARDFPAWPARSQRSLKLSSMLQAGLAGWVLPESPHLTLPLCIGFSSYCCPPHLAQAHPS